VSSRTATKAAQAQATAAVLKVVILIGESRSAKVFVQEIPIVSKPLLVNVVVYPGVLTTITSVVVKDFVPVSSLSVTNLNRPTPARA
jgi:hypothetical protein